MTERTPLYLLGLVGALLVGGLLVGRPALQGYREAGEKLVAARAEVDSLTKAIAATRNTRLEVARISDLFGTPADASERPRRAARFYSRLEILASGANLHVESIQPRPETVDSQGLVRQPVTINLTGDLKGLVAFLAQVRGSTALVGIDRLDVRRRDDAQRPLTVQAIIVSYGVCDRETRLRLAREAAKKTAANTTATATPASGEGRR